MDNKVKRASKSTWKAVERRAAALFGTTRNRGSGSSGLATESASDSKHETLYIETKLRASPTTWTLWANCKKKCIGVDKGKTPVVMLAKKNHPGFLVVCHSSDLETVYEQWVGTLDKQIINEG